MHIVDVNVAIVANGESSHADDACRLAAIQALRALMKSGVVVLDEDGLILKTYRKYLNGKGQPGIGDAFYKHLDHGYHASIVRTPLCRSSSGDFLAFPEDECLKTFDREDRIFVALAIETKGNPVIVNAVDSDYYHHYDALKKHGVSVHELCQECLKKKP